MYSLEVLKVGYSKMIQLAVMDANCTCTLLKGPQNIIIDTLTSWDGEFLRLALQKHNIKPEDINFVVSTHGHSDHIGNNNLFLQATHIVGFSISMKTNYFLHPFETGEEYIINEYVKVVPTPGHTHTDVTVLVQCKDGKLYAVAGDLFENAEDINDPKIWLSAGSEAPSDQRKNRYLIAEKADFIVPGHGDMFKVTANIVEELKRQYEEDLNKKILTKVED